MRPSIQLETDILRADALPPQARYLYILLCALCPPNKVVCSPTQEHLARLAGLGSRTTVRRLLRVLASQGWVRVQYDKVRRLSTYTVLNPALARRLDAVERVRLRIDRAPHKGEALMREWLNLLVNSEEYEDNARPHFLINPATGERMEYDRWYRAGVAFEFNGPQHYGVTELYADPVAARHQEARDLMKQALSARHGVQLVLVHPEDLTLERMRRKIPSALPLRSLEGEQEIISLLRRLSEAYLRKLPVQGKRATRPTG